MMKKQICLSILFLIALTPLISADLIDRGSYWDKMDNGQGSYSLKIYNTIINQYNGSGYTPLLTAINPSSDPLFDYEVTGNLYDVYFKSDPTAGQVVKYVKDSIETTFQPMALNYRNALNMIEQISMPLSVSGAQQSNNFVYADVYGSGIDLTYYVLPEVLKEGLVINSFSDLPIPAQYITDQENVTLDLDFVFGTNAQHITLDGFDWDKKTQTSTKNKVYIKDGSGNVIYYLAKPYAYDSNGSVQELTYEFKKSGPNLFIILKTPYSWLNSSDRVYPIHIDPTIKIEGNTDSGDAYVREDKLTQNYGSDSKLLVRGPTSERNSYLKFNISSIPDNQNIDNAILCSYLYKDEASQTISAYHVYSDWQENIITWGNQPCGTNFNNSTACNLTAESSLNNDGNQDGTWQCWSVLNTVTQEYNQNSDKISIVLHTTNAGNADEFYSKEHSDNTLWPYLNITYSEANNLPIVSSLSLTPPSPTTNNDLTCSFTITDLDAGDSLTANITWYKNNIVYSSVTQAVTNGTQASSILDSSNTAKNQEWNCTIIPHDGKDYGTPSSEKVTILNSLPTAPNISLTPSSPYTNNDLNVVFNQVSQDNDSDTITYSYQWYRDGIYQPSITGSTVSNGVTSKNEIWLVNITPNDGQENGPSVQKSVTILNSLPSIISASIAPITAYETTTLTVSTEGWSDLDGESENYIYQWFDQNGAITGATSQTLDGAYFNKNDQIYCNVTPYDSDDYGASILTNTITIQNSLPIINSIFLVTELGFNGTDEDIISSFTYSDDDSDTITNNQTKWYKDNIEQTTLADLTIISYTNTSAEDIWIFSVRVYDGAEWGNWFNSSLLTILDISQTYPTLISPANNSYFNVSNVILTYRTPNYANMNCTIFADTTNPTTPIKNNSNIQARTTVIYNWINLQDNRYYWKVGCINETTLLNSTIKSFTIDTTYPTTSPTLTQLGVSDSDKDGNIELSWTTDPDANTYNIYRSSTEITDATNLTKIASTPSIFYEDDTTLHNNSYWYALTTVDAAGNENKSIVSVSFNATSNDTIKPKLSASINITSLNGITTIYWTKVIKDVNENSDEAYLQYKVWYTQNSTLNLSKTLVNETAGYIKDIDQGSCSGTLCQTTHSLSGSSLYYYFITTIDDANNENLTLNDNYANVTATLTPPGPSGGGGGGSGGGGVSPIKKECNEHWSCSGWYSCINDIQARTCIDINNCRTEINKPEETRSCGACEEEWQCGDWTPCVNNRQTKVCIDKNNCKTEINKPEEEQDCMLDTCSDKIKNYGEAGTDCGGPCRPCKASDFITGGAIALKATKGPNRLLLIPTIFLLIAFLAVKTIKKSDVKFRKIISALHIPLIIIITGLLIFSFFGAKITGFFTAGDETIEEESLETEEDIIKNAIQFNEEKGKIASIIFLVIITVLIGLIIKRKFPAKFIENTKEKIKEVKEIRKEKKIEKSKKIESEKLPIEEIEDMEIEIIPKSGEDIKKETSDKKTIKQEPNKQEVLNQIMEAYKIDQIK